MQAQTATHSIIVPVDEVTAGDAALIADFLTHAADGAEVSKSLRRILMAALGEVTLETNARIDGTLGLLILDDGSVAALVVGDSIAVTPAKAGDPTPIGPIFTRGKEGERGGCRPTMVCHPTPSGGIECMTIPQGQKKKKK